MYKNFRVGGGIVLGLSALVLGLVGCSTTILRDSDNNIKKAEEAAQVYSYTFEKGVFTTKGGSVDLGGITWQYPSTPYVGFEGGATGRGVQFGKGGSPITNGTLLSTEYFADKIVSQVVINTSGGKGITGTVRVGEETKPITKSATDYTFSNLSISSPLEIIFNQSSTVAIYIKKIDITYTARSFENSKNLTYHYNNGSENVTTQFESGSVVEKPADPTYTGFRFDGWYTDEKLTTTATFPITIEQDIDLYAKWVKTYNVTFINGSTKVLEVAVDENTPVTAPEIIPTKETDANYSYKFDYWEKNYKKFDFSTPITADTTLYAHYIQTRVSAEPILSALEANASISFDYKYNFVEENDISKSLKNGLATTKETVVDDGFSYNVSSSKTYSSVNNTGLTTSNDFIEVIFDSVVNDLVISFPFTLQTGGNQMTSVLTLSLYDESGVPLASQSEDFSINKSFSSSNEISLAKDVKSFKISFKKNAGNVGLGQISFKYTGKAKSYTSFSNTKVQLGYDYTLDSDDERIAETGLLVTGIQDYNLPTAGSHVTALPSEENVKIKKFENTNLIQDFYIDINFLNAEGVEELNGKEDLKLFVIPYSKENGKDYYVYGKGIQTSVSDLILNLDNAEIAEAYISYLTK